jgi:hypothetical protein
MSNILTNVEEYLSEGMLCVPLAGGSKIPKAGVKWCEIVDRDTCIAAFKNNPTEQLGVITGPVSGIFVLDLDRAKNDLEADSIDWLQGLEKLNPPVVTYSVNTPSGGRHLYFKYEERLACFGNKVKSKPDADGKRICAKKLLNQEILSRYVTHNDSIK